MDNRSDWLKLIGSVVVVSPALGYALAYWYERGYCDFFKIPTNFIQIEWPTIIIAILAALGGLFIASWLTIAIITPNLQKMSINRIKFYFALIYGICILFIAITYLTIEEAKEAGVIYLILLIFIFIAPTFIRRYKREKEQRNLIETKEIERKDPIGLILEKRIVKYILVFILILFIGYTSAYYNNRANAMNRQIFYIPSSNQQSVVLKIYGDDLICATIDHLAKNEKGQAYCIIKQEYFVLKTSEPNLSIEATQLGYVRVKELP